MGTWLTVSAKWVSFHLSKLLDINLVVFLILWLKYYPLQNVDDDASVHDKLLWAIHMSGMDDLLKFLASAQSEQQWSMHVLEIISLMFRDQVCSVN